MISRTVGAILVALPICVHAQVITPGSTQSGMSLPGPKVSGRFYGPLSIGTPVGAAVTSANRLYATPVYIGASSALKSLSFDISTGNASAWNARMCVYADNGSGLPGALVSGSDTGTIAIASGSVAGVQTATINAILGQGWYWLAFMADSSSESLISLNTGQSYFQTMILLGGGSAAANFTASQSPGVFTAQTFGACPATFGTPTYASAAANPYIVMGF